MTTRAALAAIDRLCMALLGALLFSQGAVAQDFPKLTGRVVDAADVIPADVEARLEQKLAALEQQSRRQLVVATLPSLQGYEISDYGYQLGRAWGLGDKERNDGALLIVAPNERKVRIEVGYGLEPTLTDGYSSDVINHVILPRFKAGDLPAGIEAGTDAVIHQLTLPPEEAAKVAAQAERSSGQDSPFPAIMVMLFIFFFFILPMIRAARGGGRHRRRGFGGPIIWLPGGSDWGGGSGGGWGGGGGFSGGGGSFGGGGASGSW